MNSHSSLTGFEHFFNHKHLLIMTVLRAHGSQKNSNVLAFFFLNFIFPLTYQWYNSFNKMHLIQIKILNQNEALRYA